MKTIKKLFLGQNVCKDDLSESPLIRRWKNLKMVWDSDDSGIERMIRLLLAVSQFFFIGTYVRQIFGRRSSIYRDLAIDILVIGKILFAIIVLKFALYTNPVILILLVWFIAETVLYIPTLIFASDYLSRPRSYKRGMILFFMNLIELNISFASFYSIKECMNKHFQSWTESLYFSFVTSSSTGYGDFYPVTQYGHAVFTAHSMLSVMFVILFLNMFQNKMENKGYFDDKK